MTEPKPKIPIVGVVLIVLGIALLLERLDLIDIGFGRILWASLALIGGWLVIRSFLYDERGKAFWGTVLFLASIYFLLRDFGVVAFYGRTIVPAALLVLGLAFLMLYVQNPRTWQVLIPAVILGGLGTVFILVDIGYLYRWDVRHVVRTYWPTILILIGVSLLFRRRDRQLSKSASGIESDTGSSSEV